MISFYPGPSRVHDDIPAYVRDAHRAGMLSINHRSAEFMAMSERVITLLRQKLGIPADYTVLYTTSATECWEIIAQSLVRTTSYHLFNGAFGKKWFEYTKKICAGATGLPFHHEEAVQPEKLKTGRERSVICLTQNETSNGTQVSSDTLKAMRARFPNHLIAVDATSSMAGISLPFGYADIWFASVQKCFGLPAGLGLMACSPVAVKAAYSLKDNARYNSLVFMLEMMKKWQTPFTPNVLNIYLLQRVLEDSRTIGRIHRKTEKRYRQWMTFLEGRTTLKHFIANEAVRSFTVIPVTSKEALITAIKSRARKKGFLLGEGYGELNSSTFRIANFPAIRKKEIAALQEFLSDYR